MTHKNITARKLCDMSKHPSFNGMHSIILNDRYLILDGDSTITTAVNGRAEFVCLPILHHGDIMQIEVSSRTVIGLVKNG